MLDPTGSLRYSTLFDHEVAGLGVDAAGNAYLAAHGSHFLPECPGDYDALIAKLNPTGTALAYSTCFGSAEGGSSLDRDLANAIAIDGAGNAYVAGSTESPHFPTTPDAFQPEYAGGNYDAFVTKLSAQGTQVLFSSYLGGERPDWAYGVALDGAGDVYFAGMADSGDFPTTTGAFQEDVASTRTNGFVAKIDANAGESFSPDTVKVTAAQYSQTSRELQVKATSTDPTATLIVEVTATSRRMGTLDGKNGRYSGTFQWAVNPEHITVRSTKGGVATANVTTK
jgi:hypothetical protein